MLGLLGIRFGGYFRVGVAGKEGFRGYLGVGVAEKKVWGLFSC